MVRNAEGHDTMSWDQDNVYHHLMYCMIFLKKHYIITMNMIKKKNTKPFLNVPTELDQPYFGAVTKIKCNRDWSVVS